MITKDTDITKVRSIKSQIRNLQLGTILLLIVVGCFFASFIFALNLRAQKLEVLEDVLNVFYDHLITSNQVELKKPLILSLRLLMNMALNMPMKY